MPINYVPCPSAPAPLRRGTRAKWTVVDTTVFVNDTRGSEVQVEIGCSIPARYAWIERSDLKVREDDLPVEPPRRTTTVCESCSGFYEGHDLTDGMHVWAVGSTPLEAFRALAKARWAPHAKPSKTTLADPLEAGDPAFTWGYRGWSNGTSFKIAGIHVPGGVLLTWWK